MFERFVDVSVLSLMYQQVSIPMEPAAQQRYDWLHASFSWKSPPSWGKRTKTCRKCTARPSSPPILHAWLSLELLLTVQQPQPLPASVEAQPTLLELGIPLINPVPTHKQSFPIWFRPPVRPPGVGPWPRNQLEMPAYRLPVQEEAIKRRFWKSRRQFSLKFRLRPWQPWWPTRLPTLPAKAARSALCCRITRTSPRLLVKPL